jgi:hypothetical protein
MQRMLVAIFALAAVVCATARTIADEPAGFAGRASIFVQANTGKGLLSLAGAAAFEQRGTFIRFDLLSLLLTDPSKGATGPNRIPPGGYTFVYDTSTMSFVLWSPSRRLYYAGKATAPVQSPTPSPSESPTSGPLSVLAQLKDLRQFAFSLALSPDKTTIDGHPTTNFDFKFARQVKDEDPIDVAGRASFADDLGGIPLLLTAKATKGAAGGPSADVRVALTDVKQKAPPQSDFTPPAGYAKTSSILDVLGIQLPQ